MLEMGWDNDIVWDTWGKAEYTWVGLGGKGVKSNRSKGVCVSWGGDVAKGSDLDF